MAILGKMGIGGQVDITKPQMNLKYFMGLVMAVVLVLGALTAGKWIFGKIREMTGRLSNWVEEAVAPVLG
ncbi:MAG: hypothetical protein EFT35_05100 [Methanophagales archaeon ANME-1-THS]|nr:MAG: hypothetical protein EFT35_05100 [Methanophagales archaeon ANME-1-THS]